MEESECERVCIVSLHERDSPLSLSIAHTCSPTHTHAKSKPSNHSLICHTLTVSSRNQTVKERERETFTKKKRLWQRSSMKMMRGRNYRVLYIQSLVHFGVHVWWCMSVWVCARCLFTSQQISTSRTVAIVWQFPSARCKMKTCVLMCV